jgi:predicted nuclease of predicted toxin-antitoxin system
LERQARLVGAAALSDRFLIDECLSVGLVATAKEREFQAAHVAYLGKGGWSDWNLVSYALDNDYIFVTNNRRDFLKQYAKIDLHSGFVIIVPDAKRTDQRRLFAMVLDAIASRNHDLVNKVIEVLLDGRIYVRDWTSQEHDMGHILSPKWE